MPIEGKLSGKLSRRDFCLGATGLGAGALAWGAWRGWTTHAWERLLPAPPGEILGARASLGHRLREGGLPAPTRQEETEFLIIGGGMAGLSAAWWLNKRGVKDFRLFELESEVGGNSRAGQNSVSAYPWGAHYVPLPAPDAKLVLELFEELGVIQGWSARGLPIYNELYLSADPQERVFADGRWQEGLIPRSQLTPRDREQFAKFFAEMDRLRAARGADGRRLFAIPIDESSRDAATRALDGITMREYLARAGCDSPLLGWYVNYCCRDDYGGEYGGISAWAGVHYFASRDGMGENTVRGNVLTWPEGNGWLVARLREKVGAHCRPSSLVFNLENTKGGVQADYFDPATGESTRVRAHAAIFAAPRFVAARVLAEWRAAPPAYLSQLHYSPWMVANLTLRKGLHHAGPAPLSWDNIFHRSPSLGYVNAGNQKLERYPGPTVLTYYWPLSHLPPAEARREASAKTHAEWSRAILSDLSLAHPDLRAKLARIDIWLWGHGMIRPGVGYIWGDARAWLREPAGRVHFAHTDMSGISIFEEAQFQGVGAARAALRAVRGTT